MADTSLSSSLRDAIDARVSASPQAESSIGSLSLDMSSPYTADFGPRKMQTVLPVPPVLVREEDVQDGVESDDDLGMQSPIVEQLTLGQPLAESFVDEVAFSRVPSDNSVRSLPAVAVRRSA